MKKLNLIFLFVVFVFITSFSQIAFTDETASLLRDTSISSFIAVAISDMNGDGLNDIIRLNDGMILSIEYQEEPDSIFSTYLFGQTSNWKEWSICIADVDKNGYNDILLGGEYNKLKLLKANDQGNDYTLEELENSQIFVQGSNFVDIDNDGLVDIFACHDDGLSFPYSNNGLGNFNYNIGLINTSSTIPSDNSGNYGSVWTDYNNDGNLDLYITKCRLGVTDPLDGRRVNLLFQNDGNGNFVDVAEEAGLRPLAQSWASDFGDVDNDGDLDCFIINHEGKSKIYANNGDGTFIDMTVASGIHLDLTSSPLGYQCNFDDFNNDGFIDLLYSESDSKIYLFQNNGDFTFTTFTNPFPNEGNNGISPVTGDLNDDGFLDVYVSGWFNGNTKDKLFINQLDTNNYMQFLLQGESSNINAIGARVEIYGDWGVQIREVRSGESYGIMNSFVLHFGLGSSNSIDSLIIKWPSGNIDKICGILANQNLHLTENNIPAFLINNFSFEKKNLEVEFSDHSEGIIKSWLWDFGDGTTSTEQNPIHLFPTNGIYPIALTIFNDCEEVTSEKKNIIVHSDIHDIVLYPNPVNDILFVSTGNSPVNFLAIYDVTGKLILEKSSLSKEFELDISNWASGIYLLKIGKQNKNEYIRFYKN